jgi:hypothetical protein
MVFNTTFSNISVLLMEKTGKKHWLVTSHWHIWNFWTGHTCAYAFLILIPSLLSVKYHETRLYHINFKSGKYFNLIMMLFSILKKSEGKIFIYCVKFWFLFFFHRAEILRQLYKALWRARLWYSWPADDASENQKIAWR